MPLPERLGGQGPTDHGVPFCPRRQKTHYSGKKRRRCHSLKSQPAVNAVTLEILCTSVDKGGVNDLTLRRSSGVHLHPLTLLHADGGYQGYGKQHHN